MTAHWNHLGVLKLPVPGSTPRDPGLIALEGRPAIRIFQSASGDSVMKSRLRRIAVHNADTHRREESREGDAVEVTGSGEGTWAHSR